MKALTNAKLIIRGLSKGERKDLIEWLQSENISASTRNNHMRIKELEEVLRELLDSYSSHYPDSEEVAIATNNAEEVLDK